MSYGIKKMVAVMTVVLLIVNLLSASIYAEKSPVIPNSKKGIPDKGLYLAILKELGKKSGTFTKAEAAKITGLDAINFKKERVDIKSIKGIKYLTGLTWLSLSYNSLTNLKGIERLTNLKDLSVDYNKLVSLKGIERLTKLESFDASDNKLASIEEVKNLTNLVVLHAWDNKITNISSIKKCTKLESIIFNGNRLKNLSGVEELVNLSNISAEQNRLVSVKGVENLTNLALLYVDNNKLRELPDLTKLTKLDYQNTYFVINRLSENEITKNIPEHLRINSSWLRTQIKSQNVKNMLKITKPRTVKRITWKTRKITGRTDKRARVIMKAGGEEIKRTKANEKGVFTFKNINFKKLRGKKVTLQASFWVDYRYKRHIVKTMKFRV